LGNCRRPSSSAPETITPLPVCRYIIIKYYNTRDDRLLLNFHNFGYETAEKQFGNRLRTASSRVYIIIHIVHGLSVRTTRFVYYYDDDYILYIYIYIHLGIYLQTCWFIIATKILITIVIILLLLDRYLYWRTVWRKKK